MERLVIIGSKEFGQQIKLYAERTGKYQVVGYLDDFTTNGILVEGIPVLGTIEEGLKLYDKGTFDCAFIAIGYKSFKSKEAVFNKVKGNIPLASIVLDSATILPGVRIGENVLVADYSFIDKNVTLKDDVFVLPYSVIGHDSVVHEHTYFAGRISVAGYSNIGMRCFIGVGTVIADHLTICDDVWLSLGCVVARNINKPGKYLTPSARIIQVPEDNN